MAFRFVTSQPALAPLFAAVGLGVGGSLAFATYYLSQNQDVVIRKRSHAEPWNQVQQGKNTKLFSYNPDFWSSRANIPDPRAMFKEEGASGEAAVARARAIKEAKLKPSTEQNAAH